MGQTKTCTVTNNDQPANLIIIKEVINDSGGAAVVSDFGGTIGGTATFAGGQTWTGTAAPGQNKAMTLAGTYNVVETAFPGYATTYSADCNSTIALGQTKTCTVTNNDIPAQLRVNKVTVPAIDAGRFNLTIDGTTHSVAGGVGNGGNTGFQLVNAGTHTAGENTTGVTPATSLDDYVTSINGACSAAGQITLALGQVAECTITNTKKGRAKVVKLVNGVPPNGASEFTFQLRQGASVASAGSILETLTANVGNLGILNFTTKLLPVPPPTNTYQMCEVVMPGWFTTLGPPMYNVFNAGGDNSVVCHDFSVAPGETKQFDINNTFPGGLARTIGFWKNWASCAGSNGKQKPVLDQTLAKAEPVGIPIGTLILNGSLANPQVAPDCQMTVNLLDKSTALTNKKKSSDAVFNMVAQLVAARLNIVAGAASCPNLNDIINNAQTFLVAHNFNGESYTPANLSNAQADYLNTLATLLDVYNNTSACPATAGPTPVL